MGNTPTSERSGGQPNPQLSKGYNCCLYNISSFPNSFEVVKCVVIGHNPTKTFYDLRLDTDHDVTFNNIPYFYVSGRREERTWFDYFRVGTMVQTNVTDIGRGGKRRAEIMDVRTEKDSHVLVDLRDVVTGFTVFSVTPDKFILDMLYYKDW